MRATKVLALALLAVAGCGYHPNPDNGTLGCSANHECPQGYMCRASDNKCWKNGADGGAATCADSTELNGTWLFDAASTLTLACGSNTMMKSLKDDYVDIVTDSATTVKAIYYCPWVLNVGAASSTLKPTTPAQSCMSTDPDTKAVFTWTANTFTVTACDGKHGTVSSMISAAYVGTDNVAGTCTIKITGTINKKP
jgi:hypothetical protein